VGKLTSWLRESTLYMFAAKSEREKEKENKKGVGAHFLSLCWGRALAAE